jgi:hypothetical protein
MVPGLALLLWNSTELNGLGFFVGLVQTAEVCVAFNCASCVRHQHHSGAMMDDHPESDKLAFPRMLSVSACMDDLG